MSFFENLFKRLFGKGEPQPAGGAPAPQPPAPEPAPRAGKPTRRRKASRARATEQPAAPAPAPEPPGLNEFLPIARDELKAAARKVTRWGAWFGRRDVIPPTSDPRTALIDRALVTHGLLTPEQLAEMHRVGDQMERLRSSLEREEQRAALAGEAAVRAERQRLKKKKKAEAAARERRRVEAVARRRATDIVFLGRGVSGRLGERDSGAAKLKGAGLPLLSTPADVARALQLSI